MTLLPGAERNALTRLDHIVVIVEKAHGCWNELRRPAFELHPVPIAVVVDAEAERDLREKPRHREGRRRRTGRHERADRGDDLLRGLPKRGVAAEDLRAVRELHRRARDVADRQHELDKARVLVRRPVDVAAVGEHRGEAPVGAEVGRVDRDGRPHERERGHAVAGLGQYRGALFERVEVRADPLGIGNFALGRGNEGIVVPLDGPQAEIVAHPEQS